MGAEGGWGWVDGQAPGRWELERGVARASEGRFAEAAAHLARVRAGLPVAERALAAALDAFLDGHARYWQAQQALHEASRRFAGAIVEQEARLAEIVVLIGGGPGRRARGPAVAAGGAPSNLATPTPHPTEAERADHPPGLRITCFGRFAVWRGERPLALCRNRNGQAILRYLVAHPRHRETIDALMEALWPDETPEVARHKLHCATSVLRRALNDGQPSRKGGGYLRCEGGVYELDPAVDLQIDVDAFLAHYEAGVAAGGDGATAHFEAACRLYTGPFLPEDLYVDWPAIRREQLAQTFLSMCNALTIGLLRAGRPGDAAGWALRAIEENRCDEAAYRQLMRAHAAAGNRAEALRQYHRCEQALAEHLGVQPLPETTALFSAILRGESPVATIATEAGAA